MTPEVKSPPQAHPTTKRGAGFTPSLPDSKSAPFPTHPWPLRNFVSSVVSLRGREAIRFLSQDLEPERNRSSGLPLCSLRTGIPTSFKNYVCKKKKKTYVCGKTMAASCLGSFFGSWSGNSALCL